MRRFPYNPLRRQIICGIVDGVDSGVRCERANCVRCNGMSKADLNLNDGGDLLKNNDYVWCTVHGEVHAAEIDTYHESWTASGCHVPNQSDCNPENWRTVYILGDRGEVF